MFKLREGRLKEIFSGSVPAAVSDLVFVFIGFLLLYAATSDRSYFYDSVLYSGIIRHPLGLNKVSVIFEWNHFLWYPATRAFYVLLHALGYTGLTYQAIQWFNALAGALGLAVFFSLLRRAVPRRQALFWTLLAGTSNVYWSRATGAEPYLAGTLFILLFCAALYRHLLSFSLVSFFLLCLCAGLASSFHIANNLLWAAAAAALLYHRRDFLKRAAILSGVFLVFFIPYAGIQGFFVEGGVGRWWRWGSGLVNGISPENNPLGQFEMNIPGHIFLPIKNLLVSFFYFTGWPAAAVLAAAALLLAGLAAFMFYSGDRAKPVLTPESAPLAAAFGLPFALFLLLYSVWQPYNTIYWATIVVLCAGTLAALLQARARELKGRFLPAAAFLFAGFLACNNFARMILPNYLGKQVKPAVEFCSAVAYFTYPASPVLISGGPMKVYLPYFADRGRISIELAILNAYMEKKDPIAELRGHLAGFYKNGIPVYMAEDVLTDRALYAKWHVTAEQIDSLLEPYKLMKVFHYDGGGSSSNTLYLLWPKKFGGAESEVIFKNLDSAGMQKHAAAIRRFMAQGDKPARMASYLLEN